MIPGMRTTVTLDADTGRLLRRTMRERRGGGGGSPLASPVGGDGGRGGRPRPGSGPALIEDAGAGGGLTTDALIAAAEIRHRAVIHTADADFTRFRS